MKHAGMNLAQNFRASETQRSDISISFMAASHNNNVYIFLHYAILDMELGDALEI